MTNETKCPMCDGSRVRLITFSDDELGTEPCHACGPVCAIISKCDQVQRIADGHVQTIAKLEAERDALRKRVEWYDKREKYCVPTHRFDCGVFHLQPCDCGLSKLLGGEQ